MSDKFGPSGGTGGSPFNAPAPASTESGAWKISGVQGRSGTMIDEIEISWSNAQGAGQSSPEYGGKGGNPFQFPIAADDYLTQITGTVGTVDNSVRIFSIQFTTKNNRQSRVFGNPGPAPFDYQCSSGYQITGLFGRSGITLDALGVYLDPV